jgi:hypothetical protein
MLAVTFMGFPVWLLILSFFPFHKDALRDQLCFSGIRFEQGNSKFIAAQSSDAILLADELQDRRCEFL